MLPARVLPRLCGLGVLVLFAGCGPEPLDGSTLSLESKDRHADSDRVIVKFRRPADPGVRLRSGRSGRADLLRALHAEAGLSQARALALLRRHGLEPELELWSINGLVLRAPVEVREELALLDEVESIRPDRELRRESGDIATHSLGGGPRDPQPSWNLELIGAPRLWAAGYRGQGVLVAGLDTGVDVKHLALSPGWRASAGWLDPYGQHKVPADADGHGTQTMGLMVGRATGARLATGVAPEASFIAARVFDGAGKATLSAIHKVFQWLLDPDGDPATDDAPDVVSGSWGFDQLAGKCFLEFEPDLAALRAAGTAAIFSAGNSGPGGASSTSPANNPSALAVGSIEPSLALQSSSSRGPDACGAGPFPELVAPGGAIRTIDRTLGGLFPRATVLVDGTSFAAPQVAGAIALLIDAHPQASLEEIEEALVETARDLGPAGADAGFGHGLIDLPAAHARLDDELGDRSGDRPLRPTWP